MLEHLLRNSSYFFQTVWRYLIAQFLSSPKTISFSRLSVDHESEMGTLHTEESNLL